ncbi:hypothetical protein WA158_007231 [Blastocystis sp. Blastoise]
MASCIAKLAPLADRIIVKKLIPQAKTASGILLPEKSIAPANQAEVIAVGPGRYDNNGKLMPMNCKKGDRVLIPEFGGTPIKMQETEYYMFSDVDVLGKFM